MVPFGIADEEKRIPLDFYRSEGGVEPVREWRLELPVADRKKIGFGLKELEYGWPRGMPLCRALGQGLFELRVSLASRRIARVMVCPCRERLIALHGFIKKSQTTPKSEMELARKRKREIERVK